MNNERAAWAKSLGLFGIIVAEVFGLTGAGIGAGYLAWNRWGAPWWLMPLLGVAGLSMAMYRLYLFSQKNL